jgi:hypothetical protein
MRIDLKQKVRGEEAVERPGEYHAWMIAHLEMACPQCNSVQEFLRAGLQVKEWQPVLTIIGDCICPKCGVVFQIHKGQAYINEPPLPPLDPNACFVCERHLYAPGRGPVKSEGVPPLCVDCTVKLMKHDPETRVFIIKKAQDYDITLKLESFGVTR